MLAANPEAMLMAATNADDAGHRYAERLEEIARAAGVRFERILPPGGVKDWNDHLRACANPSATGDLGLTPTPARAGEVNKLSMAA